MVHPLAVASRGDDVIRTIILGSCVFVQGLFVRALPGGNIVVRVGGTEFSGRPVTAKAG